MDFLHGIEHVNTPADVVPVNDIVTAVIGLIGTADKGDTNMLTLCKRNDPRSPKSNSFA